MARRNNFLSIDGSAFADYADKLDKLGANLEKVFSEILLDFADDVQDDVRSAITPPNLPERGKYSTGDTDGTVLEPQVRWCGSIAEVPIGFDKTKPGAGGFLITGTPKMAPDAALNEIFTSKKYANRLKKNIEERLQEEIDEIMGG